MRSGYRDMLFELADLLMDEDAQARIGAAKALALTDHEAPTIRAESLHVNPKASLTLPLPTFWTVPARRYNSQVGKPVGVGPSRGGAGGPPLGLAVGRRAAAAEPLGQAAGVAAGTAGK